MINIGFNKGYNFALWASLWLPHSNVNAQTWYQALNDSGVNDCGACKDCKYRIVTPHIATNTSVQGLNMIGIDLNKKNMRVVDNVMMRLAMQSRGSNDMSIKTIHAAASSKKGLMWMRRCGPGNETCSLDTTVVPDQEAKTKSFRELEEVYDRVPVTTVDQLVSRLTANGSLYTHTARSPPSGLPRTVVDILQIDTEGNDALVLSGARNTLRRGLVRLLLFEYHVEPPWSRTSLEEVVGMLAKGVMKLDG